MSRSPIEPGDIFAPGAFDNVTPGWVPVRGPDGELLGEAYLESVTETADGVILNLDLPPAAADLILGEDWP